MTASVECLDAVAEHRVGLFAHAFVRMADFAGMFAGSVAFVRYYYKTISGWARELFPCFALKSQTLKV